MWHNKLHSEIVSRPDISYFDYCVENLYEKTAIAILFFTALWCRFCVSFRNVTDALSAHNFMDVDKICDEFNEITKKNEVKISGRLLFIQRCREYSGIPDNLMNLKII